MTADPADGVVLDHHDRQAYRATLVERSRHPPEVEGVIAVVKDLFRARNEAYRHYLQGSVKSRPGRPGRPGYESQSPRWREAEAAAFAGVRALAAVLAVVYPGPREPPLTEARALVQHRLGPLCTGWNCRTTGTTIHHPDDSCPAHPKDEER